ncbi:MAG: hypothetical protein WCT04_12835 [Planctomycetota bacterium]
MAFSGPAFPESLPPKPNYFPAPQRPASPPSKSAESNFVVNIILGFLALGVVGNLALTLYSHHEKEIVKTLETSNKEAQLIDEMTRIRSELTLARKQLSDQALEIRSMKVSYQTVIAQVGNVTKPSEPKYVPIAPAVQPKAEK